MAVDNKLVVKMAQIIAFYKVNPHKRAEYRISDYELEADGRKSKSLFKELVAAGYVQARDDNHNYVLTELSWQQVEAVKPNLFSLWQKTMSEVDFKDHAPVVRFEQLSLSEKKWCLDNYGQYLFCYGEVFSNWAKFTDYVPGSASETPLIHVSYDVFVGDSELTAKVEEWRREKKIEEAYRYAFFSGLIHLGILPKDTEKFFEVSKNLGFSYEKMTFSPEPTKWEKEVKEKIDFLLKEMENMAKKLKLMFTLQSGVYTYGGWEKFLNDYRNAVVETVDKKD